MLNSWHCYQIPKLFHLSIKVPIALSLPLPALSQRYNIPSISSLFARPPWGPPPQPVYLAALSLKSVLSVSGCTSGSGE